MKLVIPVDDALGHVIEVDFRAHSAVRRFAGECFHRRIVLDRDLAEIECGDCHAKLNPVQWIENQARVFEWMLEREREARATIAAANARTRTKCQHFGQMTGVKISRANLKEHKHG